MQKCERGQNAKKRNEVKTQKCETAKTQKCYKHQNAKKKVTAQKCQKCQKREIIQTVKTQ